MKISLENVASYKGNTDLNTDKKVNLIYGLNGVGKTILSNYLYSKGKENQEEFQNCFDDIDESIKILVYNEKFIEDNFYEKDKIKGIFTLSSENKEAEENILKATKILEGLNKEKKNREEDKEKNEKEMKNLGETEQKKVWEIKKQYTGGDRLLDYCLDGVKGNKEKLFEYLLNISKLDIKPQKTIEQLKEILKSIKKDQKEQKIEFLNNDIKNQIDLIEQNDLFKEVIIGSQDSPLSELIEKLQNSDWVKKGFNYLPEDIKESIECPFCQEKTITKVLMDNMKKYFDQSYQDKINKLKALKNNYEKLKNKFQQFESEYKSNVFINKKKDQFDNILDTLNLILNQNLKEINDKIKNPSQKANLVSSKEKINSLIQFIDELNKEVEAHNQKITNAQKEKNKIKGIFWQIMRYEYDSNIEHYKENKKKLEDKKKEIENNLKQIQDKINQQNTIIKENQEKTISIEKAIHNINRNLKDIGIIDFKIEKNTENEAYFLKRNSSSDSNFKSLSEGEKTIISFLYFLELCEGKSSRDELSHSKIAMIDDPISSLSHIYIFNVAQFIKHKFFNKTDEYEKIFILTHSLYFFHELIKINGDEQTKYFRITKNPSSQIKEIQKTDIKNDYESYWQIVKEYSENPSLNANALLPNVMRNILEHFFGFIDKSELKNAINKVDPKQYSAFIRFINRESHSDSINITDTKEIDHSLFLQAFEEIFKESGHKKHYDKMMA